jgi:hypothetical protein
MEEGPKMRHELCQVFEQEMRELTERVGTEREALDGIVDAETAAIARASLAAAETLLADVTAARNAIATAEVRAAESVEKFRKWRGIVTQCRDAKAAMEALPNQIEAARIAHEVAQNALDKVLAKLGKHTANPLRIENLPTEPEHQVWLKQKAKLEAAVTAALAERNSKGVIWGRLKADWMAAARRFDQLSFAERMARVPIPQPKSLANLAGVR